MNEGTSHSNMNQTSLSGFHAVDFHDSFGAGEFRELRFDEPEGNAESLEEDSKPEVKSATMTGDLEPTPIELMSWSMKSMTSGTPLTFAQEKLNKVIDIATHDFFTDLANHSAGDGGDDESIGTIDMLDVDNPAMPDDASLEDEVIWMQSNIFGDGGACCDRKTEKGSFDGVWERSSPDARRQSQKFHKKNAASYKSEYAAKDRKTRSWRQSYELLTIFKSQYGHSNVSVQHAKERRFKDLLQWVKRQRYHKKLLDEGKPSPLTPTRMHLLDSVGFVWNNHVVVWEAKFEMLVTYRRIYGHCNVPRSFPENPALASWVKRQRQCYSTGMIDLDRIERLNRIGFIWDLTHHKEMMTNQNGNES